MPANAPVAAIALPVATASTANIVIAAELAVSAPQGPSEAGRLPLPNTRQFRHFNTEPRPYQWYTVTAATSFRMRATHESGILLRFAPGNKVLLLEKTDIYWWKVRFDGKVGWIKAAH
ncbi:MAG: hypothetical protein KDC44_15915, partial [Phaeodactylibacter sp.]|nr:hypothetical protein [Phaeodactylibacter sp.]